jgi:ATP-binding cassette subfamily B protein
MMQESMALHAWLWRNRMKETGKKNSRVDWKQFLSYYKPYWWEFAIDLLVAGISAAIALVIPLIVRYITGTVVYMPSEQVLPEVIRLAGLIVLLVIMSFGCSYFMTYWGHLMGTKIERDMRHQIFEHLQKMSFTFYDNQKTGQLMSRVTNDLFDITELLHHGPENLLISIVKFIGAFVILLRINWRLALTAFALVPVMAAYAYFYNGKMRIAYRANRARIADINTQLEDSLSGARVVKSFANEELEIEKFDQGNQQFVESKRNTYRYMAGYNSVLNALTTLITVLVVLAAAVFISKGSFQASDLVVFVLYISTFTEPIKTLVNFTEQFQSGMSGYDRFREILDTEPDIVDRPNAADLEEVKGDISFQDVTFHYDGYQELVLHHLNLDIKAGQYVALVGTSGVGKSTLCNLIPRFYEVTQGAVKLDGRDVRDIKLHSLRSHIGIVQQDVYLFGGTVLENIRYGKPDATREEVVEAAKNANAHDFIMELPDGYDTDIGQRGIKLSGGQKQRLSLARVFLKDPEILIFDEATSALDNESEKIVQDSLERLAKGRTTLVIAHRLSTIRNAEKILVLAEEGVVEQGSHKELLEKKGVYEKLYQMQFG